MRSACDSYCYLEIGSYLGGSIQPHLLDPKCASIISIDKRTEEQVDDYGTVTRYEGNSTERMMAELQEIDPNASGRIVCFDSNASEVEAESLPCTPDLCLIDGLHTTPAVLSDFAFCFEVCSPNAVIAFHDDLTITTALWQTIPIMSYASRSCQSAAAQTWATEGIRGSLRSVSTLTANS